LRVLVLSTSVQSTGGSLERDCWPAGHCSMEWFDVPFRTLAEGAAMATVDADRLVLRADQCRSGPRANCLDHEFGQALAAGSLELLEGAVAASPAPELELHLPFYTRRLLEVHYDMKYYILYRVA
jgi:hypothetical protein